MYRKQIDILFKNENINGLKTKYGSGIEAITHDEYVFDDTLNDWVERIGNEMTHIKDRVVPLIKSYSDTMKHIIEKHMSETKVGTPIHVYDIPDVIYAKADLRQFERMELPTYNDNINLTPMEFPKEELTVNIGPLASDMNDYLNSISKETLQRVWRTYITEFKTDNIYILNLTGNVLVENGEINDIFVLYTLTECMISNVYSYPMALGDYEHIAAFLNAYAKNAVYKILKLEEQASNNDHIFMRGDSRGYFTTKSLVSRAKDNEWSPELIIDAVKPDVTLEYVKSNYYDILDEARRIREVDLVRQKETEAANIKGMYVVTFRKLDLPKCTNDICPDISNLDIFTILNTKTPFELQDANAICSDIIGEVLYKDTNIKVHMETINKYLNDGVSIDVAIYLAIEDSVCWHVSLDLERF